ncbi:MAG: hypothetical protein QXF00_06265, partial [Desulfurococcaceae archaeon]
KALHEFLWFIYSAPYSIINALNIKQLIKRRLVKNELLINPSTSVKSNPRVAKYAVLGVLHGIMEDHYFRKKTEQWFDKFIPRADIDYLDYLRLDYSTWSGGSFSLKDLLLYLIMPDKAMRKDVGINILIRRLKN